MLLPTYPKVKTPTLKGLYCYLNSSHKMQLVRVKNLHRQKLEKIVFPRQRFLFEAIPDANLEVYIEQEGKEILQKTFSCHELQIGRSD